MVEGQVRGFCKIGVSFKKEGGYRTKDPHIQITIENSKFTIHPKDSQRLIKLGEMVEFARIIESKWINEKGKSNSNWKIAKAIANALRIQIDFNHFSKAKTVVLIPVQMDKFMEMLDDKSRASKYMIT